MIYVVTLGVQYEGETLLGAFLSLESARKAVEVYVEENRPCFCDLFITAFSGESALEIDAGEVVFSETF